MDRSIISGLQQKPYFLAFLIAAITISTFILNGYGLMFGITNVLPHLFYIPIILVAYFFPRRGILFACALSVIYCIMTYLLTPQYREEILPVAGRIAIFILIATVVSLLTLRMRESERQFRGVAERSSDIIIITDSTAKIRYISPAVKKIIGYDPAEITGHVPQSYIHPDDLELLQDTILHIAQGSVIEEIQLRIRKKDGDYVVLEFTGSPVIQDGRVTGIQVIGRDITARKRVEVKLRDASRRLADVIGSFPDPTVVIDADGTVMAWNRAMEKLTGIAADSILGKGDYAYAVWFYGEPRPVLIDLVLHDDKEAIARLYPRYRQLGQTIRAEVVTQRPDGTQIDFWLTATPLFNRDGETIGAIESLRDVTRQKAIARAVLESKNYLDAIINTISDPVFVKDRQFRFVTVNDGFCQFIGHTREEILGKTDYDFFKFEEADIFRTKDAVVFGSRVINENEEFLTDISGARHTIVTKKSLYVNGDGGEFIVGIIRDISDRKQLENALLEVNKKLSLLSSITRHDINNQLFSLKAFLELSKESLDDTARISEYILKAEQAATAIERQIVFTREYQDLGAANPVWQNISPCLKTAMAALPMRDIRIMDMTSGFEIFADPLFEKVFYNLIDNALRYGGPEMTEIRISAVESDAGLVIAVEDDGAGVSAEDKKQLFKRGFGHNTGLGLFLSREILSITGITIMETGKPGTGARFEILVLKGGYRPVS
jgi:PAS domain S-box-containing protein